MRPPAAPTLLRCPHCGSGLTPGPGIWTCASGHAFDVARQGYVNLTAGAPAHSGDTAEMLDARAVVLAGGHLDVVTQAVLGACEDLPAGALVEVGAGTAHHLAQVRAALGQRHGVAIDVSVAAAKRAARVDPEWVTAVVADVWQPWPLCDGVAAAVLSIFSPRNPAEAARVLVPGGVLVVVAPAEDHLAELAGPLELLSIEAGKRDRLVNEAAEHLEVVGTTEARSVRVVDRDTAVAIALMGPAAHHVDPGELQERGARLPREVQVTIAVEVTRFRSRVRG